MNAADWSSKLFNDQEYDKCIEMAYPQQKDPDVLFYAAMSLDVRDRTTDAIAMFRRALFHKPNHEPALRALAWCLKEDVARLVILERLAHENLAESDDLCLMAQIHSKNNHFNEAHHWFQTALEKEPNNALAHMGLSELHTKLAIRYLQNVERQQDIDLTQQMSDEWDAEEVMRFIYDNVTVKKSNEVDELQELFDHTFIPTA